MVELAFRALQVLAAVGGAYLIALWFVLIVWTYRDIESRSGSVFTQLFSTLLVVLFFVPGILLYLLLRPRETLDDAFQRSLEEEYLLQDLEDLRLCPGCHRAVEGDYVLCPQCQTQLRESCAACGRLVDVKWPVCPYCAAPQKERGVALPKVAPPPARFIAPGARKRRERTEIADGRTEPLAAGSVAAGSVPVAADADAERPVVRPLDRFRPRPVDAPPAAAPALAPAPARGDAPDPFARRATVGEGLLRSLEQREAIAPIAPGAAVGSGPGGEGAAPVDPAATLAGGAGSTRAGGTAPPAEAHGPDVPSRAP